MEASRRILDMYINYEILVKEISGPGIIHEGDGYKVRSLPLMHSKPCLGFAVEEEMRPGVFLPENALALGVPRGPLWSRLQSGAEVVLETGAAVKPEQVMGPSPSGRKFSFVTDTSFVPELAKFVKKANLLVCEGMFGEDLSENARDKQHLTAKQAAWIAREGSVARLGLIHYSPRYTERELRKLLHQAREIFPNTFLTRDLQTIDLPYEE
ncbi:Ribonuclease BN [subsurface metagenome]